MNDKLNLLLNQIKINETTYFEGGKLEKIICNKAKDKYVFCVSLNKPLPVNLYENFNKKLKQRFNVKSIKSKITTSNFNIEILTEYYNHFLEKVKPYTFQYFLSACYFFSLRIHTSHLINHRFLYDTILI